MSTYQDFDSCTRANEQLPGRHLLNELYNNPRESESRVDTLPLQTQLFFRVDLSQVLGVCELNDNPSFHVQPLLVVVFLPR